MIGKVDEPAAWGAAEREDEERHPLMKEMKAALREQLMMLSNAEFLIEKELEKQMNQEITDFINALNENWQVEAAKGLRDVVHEAIPDAQERIQYKKPHFLKNGKYAAVISPSKAAVSFTIFNPLKLDFPEGFEGPPERKTLKLKQGESLEAEKLASLLKLASEPL